MVCHLSCCCLWFCLLSFCCIGVVVVDVDVVVSSLVNGLPSGLVVVFVVLGIVVVSFLFGCYSSCCFARFSGAGQPS